MVKLRMVKLTLQLSFMPFYPKAATQPGPSTPSALSSRYTFNWRRLQGVRDDKFMAPTIGTLNVRLTSAEPTKTHLTKSA